MRRAALAMALALAGLAWAQPKDTPDASEFPDASVGEGGADRTSQETEDSSTACTYDRDCDKGTFCKAGRCVYQPYRDATFGGCSEVGGVGAVGLGVVAWALVALQRARRRP